MIVAVMQVLSCVAMPQNQSVGHEELARAWARPSKLVLETAD